MRIRLIAFTRTGVALAGRLATGLVASGHDAETFAPARLATEAAAKRYDALDAWVARAFAEVDALVFVAACGIAVRAIAPQVQDKFRDPAVVCVDELGRYAVALLSGHVGGANELARELALLCGGQAVVSTATDLHGRFAVDEWARANDLVMLDRALAKEVSVALLEGRTVGLASELPVSGELPEGLVWDPQGEHHELGISVALDSACRPFPRTLRLVPRLATVGVGCKRGTAAAQVAALVDRCLADTHIAREAVRTLATIDRKADEPALRAVAQERGWELRTHTAEELARVPGSFSSSTFVQATVGVDNVCERAACACGERLRSPKRADQGVTVAIAVSDPSVWELSFERQGVRPREVAALDPADRELSFERQEVGPREPVAALDAQPHTPSTPHLYCVGLGPGGADDLTLRARAVLSQVDLIVGYTTYIKLLGQAFPQAELRSTGMRGEVERCRMALAEAASGRRVAVVCSGDPGIYGMASLLFELAADYPEVAIEVVPGVTAANGGAAVLGAPLSHDWCSISLSDLLTPWEQIERRLAAAARADFCICLYNPASKGRPDHLRRACDVLLAHRSADTACGYVRNIGRAGQEYRLLTLGELRDAEVDMRTCVYVGNSQTRTMAGRLVTPRGYRPDACGDAELPSDGRDARRSGAVPDVPSVTDSARAGAGAGGTGAPKASSPEQPAAPSTSRRPAVLLFGGTAEGRELVEWLAARDRCDVVACTATDYGASLLPASDHVRVLRGPLTDQQKRALVDASNVTCIVDATHPYARHISQSIETLASSCHLPLVRITRDATNEGGPWLHAADAQEAAELVAKLPGRVLLTTGSKDLPTYVAALPDFPTRLYVRVLPVPEALERTRELGIPASHVIAMQGPFSTALNEALLRSLDIDVLVTKDSGATGGFAEKLQAAEACGVQIVVVDRPAAGPGVGLAAAKRLLEAAYGI